MHPQFVVDLVATLTPKVYASRAERVYDFRLGAAALAVIALAWLYVASAPSE